MWGLKKGSGGSGLWVTGSGKPDGSTVKIGLNLEEGRHAFAFALHCSAVQVHMAGLPSPCALHVAL